MSSLYRHQQEGDSVKWNCSSFGSTDMIQFLQENVVLLCSYGVCWAPEKGPELMGVRQKLRHLQTTAHRSLTVLLTRFMLGSSFQSHPSLLKANVGSCLSQAWHKQDDRFSLFWQSVSESLKTKSLVNQISLFCPKRSQPTLTASQTSTELQGTTSELILTLSTLSGKDQYLLRVREWSKCCLEKKKDLELWALWSTHVWLMWVSSPRLESESR